MRGEEKAFQETERLNQEENNEEKSVKKAITYKRKNIIKEIKGIRDKMTGIDSKKKKSIKE